MYKVNIRISTEFKKITINYTMTINYDELDVEKYMLFIWKNDNIVGSMCFIPQYKYVFEVYSNKETKFLNGYDELKEYLINKNLVK